MRQSALGVVAFEDGHAYGLTRPFAHRDAVDEETTWKRDLSVKAAEVPVLQLRRRHIVRDNE
jgi:hypothetical protein